MKDAFCVASLMFHERKLKEYKCSIIKKHITNPEGIKRLIYNFCSILLQTRICNLLKKPSYIKGFKMTMNSTICRMKYGWQFFPWFWNTLKWQLLVREKKKAKWYGEDAPNMDDNEAWNKWRRTEQNTGKKCRKQFDPPVSLVLFLWKWAHYC